MTTSESSFGQLRSLMNLPHWTAEDRDALCVVVNRCIESDPERYLAEWVPYMAAYTHHWDATFESIQYNLGNFHTMCERLPMARFDLYLRYYPSHGHFCLSDLRYPGQLHALTVEESSLRIKPMSQGEVSHYRFTSLQTCALFCLELDDNQCLTLSTVLQGAPLKTLALSELDIGVTGLKHLIEHGCLDLLHTLELVFLPELGSQGVRELLNVPNIKNLKKLNLGGCSIGMDGISLLKTIDFHQLESLLLFYNELNDFAILELTKMPALQSVTELYLHDNFISDLGVQALASCPYLGSLRTLIFGRSRQLSAESRRALATSPYLHDSIRQKYQQ